MHHTNLLSPITVGLKNITNDTVLSPRKVSFANLLKGRRKVRLTKMHLPNSMRNMGNSYNAFNPLSILRLIILEAFFLGGDGGGTPP